MAWPWSVLVPGYHVSRVSQRTESASRTGQDWAIVQAGAGQVAQLDLRALWTSPGNNLRVYVDGGEETLLRGTVLPPADGGGRRFRSKPGGKIELLLVTDVLTSLSFVSLSVWAPCVDASRRARQRCSQAYRAA